MRRRAQLLERIRGRIPREHALVRAFEPVASSLTTTRGLLLPTLRFVRHHGLTVGSGPFAGLRYPRGALLHVPGLATRLAGAYELELAPAVEDMISRHPRLVVNIGAGDGYYAVGMAIRCPDAHVVVYEADPYQAWVCDGLARANGVAERIAIRPTCQPEDLAALNPPSETVVICDCEGWEDRLMVPERFGWLRSCPVVIEAHETLVPGIAAELRERFQASHHVRTIEPARRYVEDHPLLAKAPNLSAVEQEMLAAEVRHWHTPWLFGAPREVAARDEAGD